MVVVLWLVVQFCLPSPASAVLVHASTSSLSLLCVVGEAASASEPALVDKKGSLFVQQLWNFTRSILFRRFKSSWVSSCLLFLQEFSLLLCVTFRVLIGFRNKTWCVLMKFLGRSALYITQLVLERPILLTWTEKNYQRSLRDIDIVLYALWGLRTTLKLSILRCILRQTVVALRNKLLQWIVLNSASATLGRSKGV